MNELTTLKIIIACIIAVVLGYIGYALESRRVMPAPVGFIFSVAIAILVFLALAGRL